MTRFMARHPLLVGTALFLVYVPVFVALFWSAGLSGHWAVSALGSLSDGLYILWAFNLLWPCTVALFLNIARRRCQLSTGTLYGLIPMAVVQFAVQFAVAACIVVPVLSRIASPAVAWGYCTEQMGDWGLWSAATFPLGGILLPLGILAGILLGNVLANHLVRSGRWQTSPDRDAVVRRRLTGLVANIAGLAKRPEGRSGQWTLRPLTYASEHPLGTASALWFVHVPFFLLLGAVYRAAWPRHVLYDDPLPALIHFALIVLLAAVVPAAMVLLRRRSGQRAGMLWWLVPVAGYQAFVQTCFLTGARPHFLWHSFDALADILGKLHTVFAKLHIVRSGPWTSAFAAWLSAALAALAALAGLVIGLIIARRKLRTGRWEHIEPVEAADAGGGAP